MQLANEDQLRLNVLLAQDLHAVRIDESRMTVYALSSRGEAKVPLNPLGREEQYLRLVRQTLSSHVLGSPGGYPVYLKRWTRMGQARTESLEKLLLLGEPEAVAAVVHAAGLTDELARRAWWAVPSSENARQMLERECVAQGSMGPVLAEFLLEFLPFEEEPQAVIDAIRLILQPGLMDLDRRSQLWERGKRKNTYYVGFLQAIPDELPVKVDAHPQYTVLNSQLKPLIDTGNPMAIQLQRVLDSPGQAFLQTVEKVLQKPVNQDVVVALFDALGAYFKTVRVDSRRRRDIGEVLKDAEYAVAEDTSHGHDIGAVVKVLPGARDWIRAMVVLSMVSEQLVAPVFGLTSAVGSVMRKKIEPITQPITEQIAQLSK